MLRTNFNDNFKFKILVLDLEFLKGENLQLVEFKITPKSFFSKMGLGAFLLNFVEKRDKMRRRSGERGTIDNHADGILSFAGK